MLLVVIMVPARGMMMYTKRTKCIINSYPCSNSSMPMVVGKHTIIIAVLMMRLLENARRYTLSPPRCALIYYGRTLSDSLCEDVGNKPKCAQFVPQHQNGS